jgi:uncharacterized protein YcbX
MAFRVAEIWRHPVKSLGGERLERVAIDARGIHADRLWAVRDLELGAVTTARRLPMLLGCTARFTAEPPADAGPGRVCEVAVTFPGGEELTSGDPSIHDRLSALCGRRVELTPLPGLDDRAAYKGVLANQADLRRQFGLRDDEPLPDLSMFPLRKLAQLARYATPIGMFADAYPLHLLTTASLRALAAQAPTPAFDVRRFRPSLLVDTGDAVGLEEFGWCGGTVEIGAVHIRPEIPTIRCSIPTRTQPGLDADPDVVRTINAHADHCLGVYAEVAAGGRIAVGDEVRFVPAPQPTPVSAAVSRLRDGMRRGVTRASGAMMPRGRASGPS